MKIESGRLFVGNVPATQLARAYGTPLYAYDAGQVRRQMDRILRELTYRPLEICYSSKANPSLGLLRLMRTLGAGIDACSPGDLSLAAAAGYADADITYVGCAMSNVEIDRVASTGVFFVADSLAQLDRMGRRCPGRAVGLRLNVGVAAGFHPHVQAGAVTSKFGIHPCQLPDALEVAARHDLEIACIHSHIGSDILDVEPHLTLLARLLQVGGLLPDLRTVDIGGGWGTPFRDHDREYDFRAFQSDATTLLAAAAQERGQPLTLRLEPGAFLTMDSGVLLTTVTEFKPSVAHGDTRTPSFACVDTSSNHLISAVLYGTPHPIVPTEGADRVATDTYHIVGNLMQAGDVLGRDRALRRLDEGDVLAIGRCGAYSSCRATDFNQRPRPAEVLVDGNDIVTLRRRETEEDLMTRHASDPRTA